MNEKMTKEIFALELPTTPKMVLLSLAYTTNKDGFSKVSLRKLCNLSGCSKGSLAYVLKALELSKALLREQQKTESGKDSDTIYRIVNLALLTKDKYQKNYHKSRQYIAKDISSKSEKLEDKSINKPQEITAKPVSISKPQEITTKPVSISKPQEEISNSKDEIQRHKPRKMSWI